MAITATTALSSATAKSGQVVTATVTVTNSGGAAVSVLGMQPTAPINGATAGSTSIALGVPPLGPGMTTSVAASGTLALSFGVVAHEPTTSEGLAETASVVYSIGATIYTSDGSVTAATPTTLTVTNPAGL